MPRVARATLNTSRGRPSSSSVQNTSSDGVANVASSSSGVSQRRPGVLAEEDEGEEMDEDEGEDTTASATVQHDVHRVLNQFDRQAQILSREVADPSLRNMINEWTPLGDDLRSAMSALRNVAEKKAEALEMAGILEEDAVLKRMEKTCKKFVDLQETVESHRSVLVDLRQAISSGTEITDAAEHYGKKVNQRTAAYHGKTQRAKYGSSKAYEKYKRQVWQAMHLDSVMPPVSELLPAETGDEEDDDDEVAVTGGSLQEYKCPITLQIMEDPVRSKICQHAFERTAIYSMLGSAMKPCPAQCRSKLRKSDLVEDAELARACKAYKRRSERHRERARIQASGTMLD